MTLEIFFMTYLTVRTMLIKIVGFIYPINGFYISHKFNETFNIISNE